MKVQSCRAAAAGLGGGVLGFCYLNPLVVNVRHIDDTIWSALPVWALPLVSALAAGTWAWNSAFGCRLIGTCTLLTAAIVLFPLLLGTLVEAPTPAWMFLLPIGVAALGLLAMMAGSTRYDRRRRFDPHARQDA